MFSKWTPVLGNTSTAFVDAVNEPENHRWQPLAGADVLRRRDHWLRDIRAFFAARDVIEVHTPLLGQATVTDPDVGAIAVSDRSGFLQTSPEYFMKRLLAAGAPSCYQLAPVFRADEVGRHHNTEFLMLEWYRLGFDHHQLMAEVAALVACVLGPADVQTVSYEHLVGDVNAPRDELDLRFSEACAALAGRWFVVDYPADQAVLARLNPDQQTAARFEIVVDGVELANGYWELTDPAVHRQRFAADNSIRRQRELPEVEPDARFLAAMDHGLPECAGVALGLDRLFMLGLGASNLDAVLSFRR